MSVSRFDPDTVPLSGLHLIEASAGTGKTWNIERLFQRLVVEGPDGQGLSVARILVVSFTNAATAELRERVRRRLREAAEETAEQQVRERLRGALRDFDQAAIYTIHGFCQRVLQQRGFECGLALESELAEASRELLDEFARDFWRRVVIAGGQRAALGRPFPQGSSSREHLNDTAALLKFAGGILGLTPHQVEGQGAEPELRRFLEDFLADHRRRLRWRKRRANLLHFDDLIGELHAALVEGPGGPVLARALRERYRAALIDEFQDTDPQQYAIFKRIFIDELSSAAPFPLFLVGDPKQAIYKFRGADVYAYLDAKRDARGRQALTSLGVNHRSEPGLMEALGMLYRDVRRPFLLDPDLIDYDRQVVSAQPESAGRLEDPAGDTGFLHFWFIGRRLGNGAPRALAGHDPEKGGLFDAFQPALTEHIAGALATCIVGLLRNDGPGLRISGEALRPGHLAVLCKTNDQVERVRAALERRGVSATQSGAQSVLVSPAAADLLLILRAVWQPRDRAAVRAALITVYGGLGAPEILALENDEATVLRAQEDLQGLQDLWRSQGPARAILRLARRAEERIRARPDGERYLTDLLQLCEMIAERAARREAGPAALLAWLERERAADLDADGRIPDERQRRCGTDADVVQLLTIHKAKGLEFPVVFLPFGAFGLRKRLPADFHLDASGGSRRIDLGTADLARNLDRAAGEALAESLRELYVGLTRARHRVYIGWGAIDGVERAALSYLLHQPGWNSDQNPLPELERIEHLSDEELRAPIEILAAGSAGRITWSHLPLPTEKQLVRAAPPAAEPATPPIAWAARPLDLRPRYQVTSFSGLQRRAAPEEETDRDALPWAPAGIDDDGGPLPGAVAQEGPRGIFDLPRGVRTGNALHAILEQMHGAIGEPALRDLARRQLLRQGLDQGRWTEPCLRVCQAAWALPLRARTGAIFRLCDLAAADRAAELDFSLPLDLDPQRFRAAIRAHADELPGGAAGLAALERLNLEPLCGFLVGAQDLVFRDPTGAFQVLDWKSNHLGDRPEDYAPEALEAAMRQHGYVLQYHLYVLALDALLRLRLGAAYDYERDLGGVQYVFLRGICADGEGQQGIFRARPTGALVAALREALLGRGPA